MYETEIRNKEFENIEKWNNELILKRMLESQRNAFDAVKNNLKPIEKAVSLAVKKLKNYNSKNTEYSAFVKFNVKKVKCGWKKSCTKKCKR